MRSVVWDVRLCPTIDDVRQQEFCHEKDFFAVSAVALALSAGSAMAADLPSRKEAPVYVPPPPPPPMWTGFYVGVNIGGGWDANGGQSGYRLIMIRHFPIGADPAGRTVPNLFFLPTAIRLAARAASWAALRPATTSSSISS